MQPHDESEAQTPASEKNVTPPHANHTARNVGGAAAGLALLAAKFKGLIAILLQFKFLFIFAKIFALSWTFLLSLWLYVVFFGWRFAVVIVLSLLVHELGHYFAFRAYGLQARLPQFVPFLGAFTMGAVPDELEDDAYIALAGPLTGLALAAVCFGIGSASTDPFWIAVADVSAFLNIFNLLPILPFDGGRVAAAIWTRRGSSDARSARLTTPTRVRVGVSYAGTALGLIAILMAAHVATPGNVAPW